MPVLGSIDDGLVGEPSESFQRRRVLVVGHVHRIDLEHEAVVLGEPAVAGDVLGLLARQPRAPRGDASGAVAVRAGQADVLGDDVVVGVELGRRRPAQGGRVVGELGASDCRELDGLVLLAVTLLAVAHEVALRPDLEQGAAVEGIGQHAFCTRSAACRSPR